MALGKRKERDDDGAELQENHGSTLFVSNLPYTATSTDLQTLFSDIAPVRNAFVVCESGTGVSKGVGYVSFAMREDAQLALDKINTDGLMLVRRKLRVQWAETKAKLKKEGGDANDQKTPPQKKVRPQPRINRPSQDPLAIRTIIISGLPSCIDSNSLWKKIRKYQGAEKIEWPVSGDDGAKDSSSAHALFSTPALALDAINKLHAHVFKGSLLSVTLKKRLDTLASHKAPSAKSHAAPSHAHRLIVRNIPFSATAQDLRSIFLPYGPIYTITVPSKEPPDLERRDEVQKGDDVPQTMRPERNKGFAFVWFYSRKDAEKAMQERNGTIVRAGVAEELVKGKQKRKKERRMELKLAKAKVVEVVQQEGEEENSSEDEEAEAIRDGGKDKNERMIAVDWALSKDRWEEEKAKIEQAMADEDGDKDGVQPESDEEESENGQDSLGTHNHQDSDEESGSQSGSDRCEEGEEEEGERDQDDKPIKPQLPQTDVGTTLFIRNVPYDATDDELRTLFRTFGPLRYARITMDYATGRSRGTGFACFWNKEDADKVIEQSELLKAETTGGNTATTSKKNPFTLPSILTPDPSASLAQNLVLHGRALDVIRAVTRDEAGKLKEMGERAREKADKRNMYLLREGVILPNSPLAAHISPTDLERRTNSFNTRRALLKSNPSLYISKTRLSIRQIPLYVAERMLKRLAVHAIRAFEKEVETGKRTGLSEDELRDSTGQSGVDKEEEKHGRDDESEAGNESDASSAPSSLATSTTTSKSAKRKARLFQKFARSQHNKGGSTSVKQAKIVRQADRVDPITGKGRSRGYGFIEMYTHADALRVLRWANGNSDVDGLLRTWWKEELERLIKVEQKKKVSTGKADDDAEGREEETDARLKRMVAELEKEKSRKDKGSKEDGGGNKQQEEGRNKGRGTLIVEFSVENVQVVQRRNTVQKNRVKTEEGSSTGKKMLDDGRSSRPEPGPPRAKTSQRTRGKRPRESGDGDGEAEKGNEQKKRRVSPAPPKPPLDEKKDCSDQVGEKDPTQAKKLGQAVGSIIGRKRKEKRKAKGQ